MKTEKLYYLDSYISEFNATVLSCEPVRGSYEVVLDKTAFFPEEGGQSADGGTLSSIRVLDVRERDGVIYHILPSPLSVGAAVKGVLDFDTRFIKMQLHTAEHILSGLFHSEYGLSNVGFHLGESEVTMDTSAPVTEEMAERIETLANEAVYANKRVNCQIYDAKEAENIPYRSKLEFTGQVRLVDIEGVDVCACCAPHVRMTGEIGIIKLIRLESHKGGTRIYMLAGRRAYEYLRALFNNVSEISGMLSAPPLSVASEVRKLAESKASVELSFSNTRMKYAKALALSVSRSDANSLLLIENAERAELREAAKIMKERTAKIAVALANGNKGYAFVMLGDSDISAEVKKATAALSGKGGGRGPMAEGSFSASFEDISRYFLG